MYTRFLIERKAVNLRMQKDTATGDSPIMAEFISQNSIRTMYVQKADGDVVLAHIDQIRSDEK